MDDRIPFLSSRERRWFTAREGACVRIPKGSCLSAEGYCVRTKLKRVLSPG